MWTVAVAQEKPAEAPEASNQPQNPLNSMIMMVIVFFAIMYFLMIRPAQKREKERKDMLGSLSKNDRVVTTGGIYGTIVGLSEKSVVLRVSDDANVKIEFARGAVSQVVSREKDEKK